MKFILNTCYKTLLASVPHLNFVTKAILVSIILLMGIVGGLSIWLSNAPLDLERFKPRLEQALSDENGKYTVEIGSLALSWPALREPILFDLQMVKITQGNGMGQTDVPVMESVIDKVKIGLSARHLLIGKFLPSTVIIEDPVFQLVQQDGKFKFFWQEADSLKVNPNALDGKNVDATTIVEDAQKAQKFSQDFLDQLFSQKKEDLTLVSALHRVELRRAIIKSADIISQESGYLALVDLVLLKNNTGLVGDLEVTLPGAEGLNAIFKSAVMYRKGEEDITFTSTVQDLNPAQFSQFFPNLEILKGQDLLIAGNIKAAFDSRLMLQNAIVDFNIPQGTITIPDVYDEGLKLNNIDFEAHFDMAKSQLDITKFSANIGDIPIKVTGTSQPEGKNIILPLTLNIAKTKMEDIAGIFPKSHIESSAGQWLTQRLSDGVLNDIVVNTDFHLIYDDETSAYNGKMNNVKARFQAEGMTVKYSETLTPVKNAKAIGTYEDDTLTIVSESGFIGDVVGSNVNLRLTNLSVSGGGMAYLTLDAKGPFRSVLNYASDEPIGLGDDLGFDIKTVQGQADFKLDLQFPTLKDLPKEEVIVKIDGTLRDVLIPNVVKGLPLSGGPYALGFSDGKISLKGKGKLAKRDIDLEWMEYIDPTGKDFESKITAKLTADAGLRKAFNIGLEEYVSGPIPVEVVYVDRGVPATIEVKGNLTPATLHIDPFKYNKPAGKVGSLSLTAYMKNDTLEEVAQLQVAADKFNLKNGRLIFRKLADGSDDIARGSIAEAILDKTKLKVDFEITPTNILKVLAKGPTLELKPFMAPDKKKISNNAESDTPEWGNPKNAAQKSDDRPMQISVEVDKLLAEKGQVLGNTKLYIELDTQGDMTRAEMDADVGKGAMYLRFKPDEVTGKRNFRLESTDAGETLKAFGLYDRIKGGELLVYGEPRQGDNKGDLFGKAQITNFTVGEAPILAKLLGAMSQSGVQDVLQNNDLSFAKLESDFEWQFREGANLLVMTDGRTSGSSLGLTFEGVYNQGQSNIDVSGTVIPLSGVNKAVGGIPIIGQILTGGKALLAATYKVEGPSSDPKVSINPLSVLAPGFLRRILFEESVESKVEKAQ